MFEWFSTFQWNFGSLNILEIKKKKKEVNYVQLCGRLVNGA